MCYEQWAQYVSLPAQQSELTVWLGMRLLVLSSLPMAAIALCVSVIIASVTEVMSNIATTSLFLPVLYQLVSSLLPASHLQTWCTKTNIYTVECYLFFPSGCRAMHTPPLSDDPGSCVCIICFHDPCGYPTKCNRIFIWLSESVRYGATHLVLCLIFVNLFFGACVLWCEDQQLCTSCYYSSCLILCQLLSVSVSVDLNCCNIIVVDRFLGNQKLIYVMHVTCWIDVAYSMLRTVPGPGCGRISRATSLTIMSPKKPMQVT